MIFACTGPILWLKERAANPIFEDRGVSPTDVATYVNNLGGYIYAILGTFVLAVVVIVAAQFVVKKGRRHLVSWGAALSDEGIVLARSGGKGQDLPADMSKVIDGTMDDVRQPLTNGNEGYNYYAAACTNDSDSYNAFASGESYLQLYRTERDMIDLVATNFDKVVVVVKANNAMELGFVDDYDSIGAVLLATGTGRTDINGLGKSCDDPDWERPLEQLTPEEMSQLVQIGGFSTVALDSVLNGNDIMLGFDPPRNRDTDPSPMARFLKNLGRNFKATGPMFLPGIVLSAVFQRYVPAELVARLFGKNQGFGVLMAATIGVPLYACGGGTIPQLW